MTEASVRVRAHSGIPVASVSGEIDIVNATQVSTQLFGAAPNASPGLVVDLSGVTYLDSRGVHLLLELAERLRTHDQRLHLVVPSDAHIKRVLVLAHVDTVVPLYPTLGEAVGQMVTHDD